MFHPDNPHPYYIVTPPYVRTSAGVRGLHMLCHALNARGETAYVVLDPFHIDNGSQQKSGSDFLTPHLTQEIADEHHAVGKLPIVVYAENIEGNPFSASCIIRFFLNYPEWTGQFVPYTSEELRYGYSLAIATAAGVTDNVLYIPTVNTQLFRKPAADAVRSGSCFYADKYRKVHKALPLPLTNNSVEITRNEPGAQTAEELASLLRRSEFFYAYENTAVAIEAVLCGCPAIFIPNPHLEGIIGIERLGMDGFCWGLDPDDVARAKATVDRGAANYLRLFDDFPAALDGFILKTKAFATGTRQKETGFMIPVRKKDTLLPPQWLAMRERNAELFFRHPFLLGAASLLPTRFQRRVSEFCGTVKLREVSSVLWQNCDFREVAASRKGASAEPLSHVMSGIKNVSSRKQIGLNNLAQPEETLHPTDSREALLKQFADMASQSQVDFDFEEGRPISVTKGKRQILLSTSHLVYAGDMIDNFDYYFRSTQATSRGDLDVVDYSTPAWHTLHTGEQMFYTGLAEDLGAVEQYMELMTPHAGEVVFDVGAYCGLSSILFSKAVGPSGKVVAFEPDPNNYAALVKNLAESGVTNVLPSNTAMAGTDGTLMFSSEGNMGSYITELSTGRGDSIEVQTLTLRGALKRYGLDRVDVVKLDIEGAEYSVIESSLDLIDNLGARWAIELHADQPAGLPLSVERIRSVFDRLGYLTTLEVSSGTVPSTLFAFPPGVRSSSRPHKEA